MNQFEKRHYAFMREWRGPGRERLPLSRSVSFRPLEPDANAGDKTVFVVAAVIFLVLVLLA